MQLNRVYTFTVQQCATGQIDAGNDRRAVRACVGLLSTPLAGAVRAGMLPTNPCGGVRLPRAARREPRYLEREEVDCVASELGGQTGSMAVIAAYTGLRWGELAGLHPPTGSTSTAAGSSSPRPSRT